MCALIAGFLEDYHGFVFLFFLLRSPVVQILKYVFRRRQDEEMYSQNF
jgi:hypothetical protein